MERNAHLLRRNLVARGAVGAYDHVMTYCMGACVEDGLLLVSDSRTNAGIDQLGVASKMHIFDELEGRFFTILSAGNLATTQAVLAALRTDLSNDKSPNFNTVSSIRDAASYLGDVSRNIQDKYANRDDDFSPEADFLLGGQVGDGPIGLFHIYSKGNFVAPTKFIPFLQLGEVKYGRPILDRIVTRQTDLETIARCALVSMDSTIRCNASVGPPVELLLYPVKSLKPVHIVLDQGDAYLDQLFAAWKENLRAAFDALPPLNWDKRA